MGQWLGNSITRVDEGARDQYELAPAEGVPVRVGCVFPALPRGVMGSAP